jgi:hypothetical protein
VRVKRLRSDQNSETCRWGFAPARKLTKCLEPQSDQLKKLGRLCSNKVAPAARDLSGIGSLPRSMHQRARDHLSIALSMSLTWLYSMRFPGVPICYREDGSSTVSCNSGRPGTTESAGASDASLAATTRAL